MNRRNLVLRLALYPCIVLVAYVFSAVYAFGMTSGLPGVVAGFINAPAAKVGDFTLGLGEYFTHRAVVSSQPGAETMTDEEIRVATWDKIISEYAEKSFAHRYGLSISDEAVYQYGLESGIDWDDVPSDELAYLREHVVRPLAVRQSIAQNVLTRVHNPALEDARLLRSQLNDNPSVFDEARTAYFERMNLPASPPVLFTSDELADIGMYELFTGLTKGDFSEIIAGTDGYYLYKVIEVFEGPPVTWYVDELKIPATVVRDILQTFTDQLEVVVYVPAVAPSEDY